MWCWTFCDILYLDLSGGYTGVYICKQSAAHFRWVHYTYAISQKEISLKEDAYFHAMQTTPIRQHGLLVPCCSDQDVTSPDNTSVCMCHCLFLSLLLYHILPSLPLQAPRSFFSDFFARSVSIKCRCTPQAPSCKGHNICLPQAPSGTSHQPPFLESHPWSP